MQIDLVTLALMLMAGLLHASWHAMVKAGVDQIVALAGMGMVASVAAGIAIPFLAPPPLIVWPILVASVALHVGYKLCLSAAYMRSDLGQAFPLARGMVPLFAAVIALLTLGQVPSALQAVGIGLLSCGMMILTIGRFKGGVPWPLLGAAAGAGITVASYAVLDAYGIKLYRDWSGFTAWLIVTDNVGFLALSRLIRGPVLWKMLAAQKGSMLVSGLLGLISFTVFLWALSRSPVGVISALRESSVLFALVIGVVVHGEALTAQRALGAGLILGGILTIAL